MKVRDEMTGQRVDLDRQGFIAVPGVLSAAARDIAQRCSRLLDDPSGARQGDKRSAGTRRASGLLDRLPEVAAIFADSRIAAAVAHLVGTHVPLTDVAFRCPQSGAGEQELHTDDVPLLRAGECRAVTAIVALCDFHRGNGATAVVPGSHRRPDLQRRVGRIDLRREEHTLTGPAGTVFVFRAHLLHRGGRNLSMAARPALQAQWRLGGMF